MKKSLGGNIIDARNKYKVEKPRGGEFVIILEGGSIPKEEINIKEEIILYMEEGYSKKRCGEESSRNLWGGSEK